MSVVWLHTTFCGSVYLWKHRYCCCSVCTKGTFKCNRAMSYNKHWTGCTCIRHAVVTMYTNSRCCKNECSLLYTWLCLFHDAPLILPVSWHVLLSLFQDRYLVSMKGALYCVSWQAPNCTCSITNTQLCLFHDLSYWACFMKNAQLCMFHDKCPTACVSWRNAQLRMFHDRCPTGPVPNCTPFMTSAQLHLFNNRCWSMPVWWQMSDLVTLPVSQQM